jgi:uncharacterized Fe-S cluster protein YjdI
MKFMKDGIKEYSNGEVTIIWEPGKCIHSRVCWHGKNALPEVFNPSVRPWINAQGADTEHIITQVTKCPSGALSFYMNAEGKPEQDAAAEHIVEVMPNGPLMVYGNISVKHADGSETRSSKVTAFCRCGASANKPYCDGTHTKIGFRG